MSLQLETPTHNTHKHTYSHGKKMTLRNKLCSFLTGSLKCPAMDTRNEEAWQDQNMTWGLGTVSGSRRGCNSS